LELDSSGGVDAADVRPINSLPKPGAGPLKQWPDGFIYKAPK
jgi:hypothetical protein